MRKLNKTQANKFGTQIIEKDKRGNPVLVVEPIQLDENEYIIDEDHDELLDKVNIKRDDTEVVMYTKDEVDEKIKTFKQKMMEIKITKTSR